MNEYNELTYSLLPKEEVPALVEAITAIMAEGGAHNLSIFDRDRWEWQYAALPAGQSHVYVNRAGGKILAYYHVPLYYGKIGSCRTAFAMVQDVAVSATLRGKGVFKDLATYATNNLQQQDIGLAYTFPNDKSIRTFLKYNNYQLLATLTPYLLPLNAGAILKTKLPVGFLASVIGGAVDFFNAAFRKVKVPQNHQVEKHEAFTKEVCHLFTAFEQQYAIGLVRDEAYLTWRFMNKPATKHYLFSLNKEGKPVAAAVLKLDELFENPSLLLMDFCYSAGGEVYLLQLLQSLRVNHKQWIKEPVTLIFTSGTGKLFPLLKKAGFIKIPQRVNPRPLNLLIKKLNYSGPVDIGNQADWHVTLADWDVF